jgi:endogenous inhibitor of DNA gyrase (YacG/DUF329 family)
MICPLCKKSAAHEANPFRPFCSERCQKVDLGHWAQETYRMPLVEEEKEGGQSGDSDRP